MKSTDANPSPDPDPFAPVWKRLMRAHVRMEQAVPYSPEWAAAIAELEDICREVRVDDVHRIEVPFGARAN
jgi:hypothetical protein